MFPKVENKRRWKFDKSASKFQTKLVIPSIVSPFMTKEVTYFDGDEKKVAKCCVDDIYLLFNQRRLLSAGSDTVNAWLETLTPRSDALSQLRKKCTDEQLMAFCKSRYIQSPSELLAWSEYLLANHEAELARIDANYKEQLEKQVQTKDTSSATMEQTEPKSE